MRKINPLATRGLPVLGPAIKVELNARVGSPGKGGTVAGVPLDCLPKQVKRAVQSPPLARQNVRYCAQHEIVCSKISRRPLVRAPHLGGLHSGLDYAGDADGDTVLKLENILQQAVESIGPEIRAGNRVN